METVGPLAGLRVLEIGDFISVGYAGKLLADLGADVIKIEDPIDGDSVRGHGPFPDDIVHLEKSGLHLFLNTNKKSLTLDYMSVKGRQILDKLIAHTGLIISNNTHQEIQDYSLDYASLSRNNPQLSVSSITVFGYDTPYRDWLGTALTATAASGAPTKIGHPEKAPLWLPYCAADFHGGVHGAIAALLALRMGKISGQGHHAWISTVEVIASYLNGSGVPHFVFNGGLASRDGTHRSGFYPWQVVPAADGYMEVITMVDDQWNRFTKLMGNPDWAKDERLRDRWTSFEWHEELDAYWHPWLKERTREELFEIFSEHRIPFQPVNRIDEVVASEHLETRDFWQTIEHPVMGTYTTLGAPYKFSETPWHIYRPAPLLGQHNQEILTNLVGLSEYEQQRLRDSGVIV
tara:strand:- start:3204 stop:4418 length:1215 start_codon:yes stop_codon:yes gene_type:complete